jgi:hypothetical protein
VTPREGSMDVLIFLVLLLLNNNNGSSENGWVEKLYCIGKYHELHQCHLFIFMSSPEREKWIGEKGEGG